MRRHEIMRRTVTIVPGSAPSSLAWRSPPSYPPIRTRSVNATADPVRPFSPAKLVARIRAALRRHDDPHPSASSRPRSSGTSPSTVSLLISSMTWSSERRRSVSDWRRVGLEARGRVAASSSLSRAWETADSGGSSRPVVALAASTAASGSVACSRPETISVRDMPLRCGLNGLAVVGQVTVDTG